MKSFGSTRKTLHAASEWAYITGSLIAALVGWLNGIEKDEKWLINRPILWRMIEYIQEHSLYAYIAIGVIIATSFAYRRLGDPWVLEKLQFILDEYQEKVFSANGAPRDHDRVTIFKYKRNCLLERHWSAKHWYAPWGNNPKFSGYLVPFMRSGHISQNSRAIFYAPDDSDKAEGVAGMAWCSRRSVIFNNLPEIKAGAKPRSIQSYAKATKCDEEMVRKYMADQRTMPRSIAAIPIECNGEPWGVVVLDSRSPNGVTNSSIEHYTLTVALIGHLLEKA